MSDYERADAIRNEITVKYKLRLHDTKVGCYLTPLDLENMKDREFYDCSKIELKRYYDKTIKDCQGGLNFLEKLCH